jgi:hypothetical protein
LNPRRTACKAALRPDGLPNRNTNVRGRGRNRTSRRPLIVRLHCPLCYAPIVLYPGLDSNLHWMRSERIASAVGLPGQIRKQDGAPQASRTPLSCLEGKVLAARTAVQKPTRIGTVSRNCPGASGLATRRASHNTLTANGAPGRTCTGMRRGCSSSPICFGPREQERRRRESNARDLGRPRLSGPVCCRSSTSPDQNQILVGTHGRIRTSKSCVRSAGRVPLAVGVCGVACGIRTRVSALRGRRPRPARRKRLALVARAGAAPASPP